MVAVPFAPEILRIPLVHAVPNRRLVLDAYGDETFGLVDEAPPEPGPGEVRCRVLAASVEFTDTLIRRGRYPLFGVRPPLTLGFDFAGEVDAVGEGVDDFGLGERVCALTTTGSYARYIVRKADDLTPVPEEVDPVEATALVLSYMTAYQMMFRIAEVKAGDRILVHGLGGAVGDAALQLARRRGIRVFGTARPHHFARIEAQGGRAVDYRGDWVRNLRVLVGKRGFDAVFDPVGEAGFRKSRSLVRKGGILVPFGLAGYVDKPRFRAALTLLETMLLDMLPLGKRCRFYAIARMRPRHRDWWREDLRHLLDLLQRGEIKPWIGERIGFGDVEDAHRRLEAGGVHGKIVLVPFE
jgi:NADPH:quinone reductase-like Zn-dependent oxidoreductase